MTDFYIAGVEKKHLSVKEVYRGLANHYNTHSIEATVRAAYGDYYTPTASKRLNGEVARWVKELNDGVVPYFMGALFLTRIRKIDPYKSA